MAYVNGIDCQRNRRTDDNIPAQNGSKGLDDHFLESEKLKKIKRDSNLLVRVPFLDRYNERSYCTVTVTALAKISFKFKVPVIG